MSAVDAGVAAAGAAAGCSMSTAGRWCFFDDENDDNDDDGTAAVDFDECVGEALLFRDGPAAAWCDGLLLFTTVMPPDGSESMSIATSSSLPTTTVEDVRRRCGDSLTALLFDGDR